MDINILEDFRAARADQPDEKASALASNLGWTLRLARNGEISAASRLRDMMIGARDAAGGSGTIHPKVAARLAECLVFIRSNNLFGRGAFWRSK